MINVNFGLRHTTCLHLTSSNDKRVVPGRVSHAGKCIRRFARTIDFNSKVFDRYSNLLLNAYINRHAHTEYLKIVEVYSFCGIWHVFLYNIYTNIYQVLAICVNTSKSTYTFTSVYPLSFKIQDFRYHHGWLIISWWERAYHI